MVRLDVVGLAVRRAAALDHVRIERTLGQILHVNDPEGFVLENVDENVADAAPFLLRIGDVFQFLEKALSGLRDVQVGMKMAFERPPHRLRFALTQ